MIPGLHTSRAASRAEWLAVILFAFAGWTLDRLGRAGLLSDCLPWLEITVAEADGYGHAGPQHLVVRVGLEAQN